MRCNSEEKKNANMCKFGLCFERCSGLNRASYLNLMTLDHNKFLVHTLYNVKSIKTNLFYDNYLTSLLQDFKITCFLLNPKE